MAGIDLDGVRDRTTGALLPWAEAIVRRFSSYTEVSPSGTGVHILVRGRVAGALKTEAVEDKRGGYFTVTGQVLDGLTAIVEAPDLEAFVAEHRRTTTPAKASTLPPRLTELDDEAVLGIIAASRDAKALHRLSWRANTGMVMRVETTSSWHPFSPDTSVGTSSGSNA